MDSSALDKRFCETLVVKSDICGQRERLKFLGAYRKNGTEKARSEVLLTNTLGPSGPNTCLEGLLSEISGQIGRS